MEFTRICLEVFPLLLPVLETILCSWRDATQFAHCDSKPEYILLLFFPLYIFLHAIIQTNHTPQSPGTQFIAVIERAFFFSDVVFQGKIPFCVYDPFSIMQNSRQKCNKKCNYSLAYFYTLTFSFHVINDSNQSLLHYTHITFPTSSN